MCSAKLIYMCYILHFRTFALIVYVHPYCAGNSGRNAMLS